MEFPNNDKKRSQIAFNRNLGLFLFCGSFLILLSWLSFRDDETGLGIGLGLFALFLIAVPVIAMPIHYRFDSEGVSVHYLFLPKERYLWKNIYSVSVVEAISGSSNSSLFFRDFEIGGTVEGTHRRYMNGRISKTWRTKRLIEKYWDGRIRGYWDDEKEAIQKWYRKRKGKKDTQAKQYALDEILPMERQIRASVKGWLEPFRAEARQYGLEVRTQYFYVTKDFEELRSRPNADYTYTAVIEISRPGETDENRIVCVSGDLLYVHLGKTAYRGAKNAQAKEELDAVLSDTLQEIRKNGLAAFCRDI